MLDEGDGAVLVALLLKPRDSPTVRFDGGDHIVEAVAVHVVDGHLRAAAAEVFRMERPSLLLAVLGGLFPPSGGRENVHSSIAVDVAHADTVRVDHDFV